jgi:peptide/nickel transport system substrate-binding protein
VTRSASAAPRRALLACVALAAAVALAPAAIAKTLRVASGNDPQTMDPHSLALLYHTRIATQVYESLVRRDRHFQLEPSLATAWQATGPTTWRFKLRPNVRFHDGATFGADDAVFSIERALAKNSQRAFQMRGIKGVRKVDDLTIDVDLEAPDAVLPQKLLYIGMMSKAWATKHSVQLPQDYNGKQETYAVRNANGTGPFRLKSYEADNRVVLEAHKEWWGERGNVTEAIYLVIASDATRLAALNSGAADLVLDPPFQDVGRIRREGRFRILETADIGTQYLGFDQHREELEGSNIKGRNPFKDVRVRRAVAHAIDTEAIVAKVLRGQGETTGSFISKRVDGYAAALDKRVPYDPAAARALLREAGYPNGFTVSMDCVSITWRAAACQAVAGMLAQVGIVANLQVNPAARFFPKLTQATASFFEFGWSPDTDPWAVFNATVRSFGPGGYGAFNGGRYSNPKLDTLIDGIRVEPDLARRRTQIGHTLALMNADLPLIPLYRRNIAWTMRAGVEAAIWPNDVLELRYVRMP